MYNANDLLDSDNDQDFSPADVARFVRFNGLHASVLESGLLAITDADGTVTLRAPFMSRVAAWLGY